MLIRSAFLSLLLILQVVALGQDAEDESLPFHFSMGSQIRVTPIYLKRLPDFITLTDRNIWEQPDMHLSGPPALLYGIEKGLPNAFSFRFSQSLRYGQLYWTIPFNTQQYDPYAKTEKKRAIISDVYFDLFRSFALRASRVNIGAGLPTNGLGTGYLLTQRFVDNSSNSIYVSSKENFMFPAASLSFEWQKRKFAAGLRMGYAWHNPTMYEVPFLFPEVGVRYQLFSRQSNRCCR